MRINSEDLESSIRVHAAHAAESGRGSGADLHNNTLARFLSTMSAITQQFALATMGKAGHAGLSADCGVSRHHASNTLWDCGPEDMYWKIVTPHEVAHQWWGQTVGFRQLSVISG